MLYDIISYKRDWNRPATDLQIKTLFFRFISVLLLFRSIGAFTGNMAAAPGGLARLHHPHAEPTVAEMALGRYWAASPLPAMRDASARVCARFRARAGGARGTAPPEFLQRQGRHGVGEHPPSRAAAENGRAPTPLLPPHVRVHTSQSPTRPPRPAAPRLLAPLDRLGRPLSPQPAPTLTLAPKRDFVRIPTMLTRRSKTKFRVRVPDSPRGRGLMRVATVPRTPLEKLLHRRAGWLQAWWRRMRAQLLWARARRLQSWARMFLGRRTLRRLRARREKIRLLWRRMLSRKMREHFRGWRRIRAVRVFGIRVRQRVYHRSLLQHVWNTLHAIWFDQNKKDQRTIHFFRRWTTHRMRVKAFDEWCDFVYVRKAVRGYFIRKHVRAWAQFVKKIMDAKRALAMTGRAKLEDRAAHQIQGAWLDYAERLAALSANADLPLEVLHEAAATIQRIVRGRQGRARALALAVAVAALDKVWQKAWGQVLFRSARRREVSEEVFEAQRAERERSAMAAAELRCLRTQAGWEASTEGRQAIAAARSSLAVEPDVVMLGKSPQRDATVQDAALRLARRWRRARCAAEAMEAFRQEDPPPFACAGCGMAFARAPSLMEHMCPETGTGWAGAVVDHDGDDSAGAPERHPGCLYRQVELAREVASAIPTFDELALALEFSL